MKLLKRLHLNVRYLRKIFSAKALEGEFQPTRIKIAQFLNVSDYHSPQESMPRILLVSSNGAGLGHLTRLKAIEQKLSAHIITYSLSTAIHQLKTKFTNTIYFPSADTLGLKPIVWNRLLAAHFGSVVESFQPDVIVFDGTTVYEGINEVILRKKQTFVWIYRGCWKEGVDDQWSRRRKNARSTTCVITLKEFGILEPLNFAQNTTVQQIEPIIIMNEEEMLDRDAARHALNLPTRGKLVLIQIGAGNINKTSDLKEEILKGVYKTDKQWKAVFARNPLSEENDTNDVFFIHAYPLAKYFNAFDAAVFAGGFNSVHESVGLNLPALIIPNTETITDDQLRRAKEVELLGLGLVATTADEFQEKISMLLDDKIRKGIKEKQVIMRSPRGAEQAADIITSLIR